MRVAFLGTPEFARPALEGLVERGYDIALVVSQPDRPAGRGRQLRPPPVAAFARERGISLFQPASLRPPEAFARVRAARPDVVIVIAFGLILRRELLDLPRFGCLNVHASLLPRHRGAAPIQAAILAGDDLTGVCLMRMEAGLDTGPVLRCLTSPILAEDDAPVLTARLAELGRDLLLETLPDWAAGKIEPQPQDHALATYAPKISRQDARLDWSRPTVQLWRQVRAYRGWPDAYTTWSGRQLKVLAAYPHSGGTADLPAGRVVSDPESGRPMVIAADGALALETVALEGRRPMDAVEFARGQRQFVGATLGEGAPGASAGSDG